MGDRRERIASDALRVGVIGCGTIAHEHLSHLRCSSLAQVVGVCDRSPAAARFAAERHDAGRWYTDAEALLESEVLDVVHVLTPPQTHAPLIRTALEADLHVVCEKPMAPNEGETRALLGAARDAGKVLVESHNLLYNDPVLEIDELISTGALGEVREVDLALALDITAGPFGDENLSGPGVDLPGGAVHDFAPHFAYLLLHFAAHHGEVDDVWGRLANLSGNERVGFDHLDALVRLGGVRGHLRLSSDVSPPAFRLTVRGTAGTASTDLYNPATTILGDRDSGTRAPIAQLRSGIGVALAAATNLRDKVRGHDTYHGLPRMLDAIYAALRDGTAPPINPDDIIDTAALVDRLVALGGDER
jgi:predicted dehydrogenase